MARFVRGFTLIELMIVLVVAAILATVAVPGYIEQMRASRRAEAREMLMQIQAAQERWRSSNVSYAASLSDLRIPSTTSGGNYSIALSEASADGYRLTATAQAKQAGDKDCATITIVHGPTEEDNSLNAVIYGGSSDKCWAR